MRTHIALGLLLAIVPASAAVTAVRITGERRQSFDDNWRFFKGDAPGAEQPAFDDSKWRELSLPHDWAIEGPFDPKANPHTGALPIFGTGWYRKSFNVPDSAKDRYLSIMFDGAQNNAHVFLNGVEIGSRPYGYISFSVDLTPQLKFGGQTNVLAVRLTPEDHSSRWYPGAGIYRNAWLDITGPIHVGQWGTFVTTPVISDQQATVTAKVDLRNRTQTAAKVTLQTTVLDPSGKAVAKNGNGADVPAGGMQTIASNLTVARPQRWDLDHPAMYTLVAEVVDANKKVVDRYTTPFGIRTVKFDREQGFLLNGRHVKIQGVCDHHDLGALGAAVNKRATERQIEILKKAGTNAIRTSHNPPSPELLDACDRMGIVVMDESFDMWKRPKVPNGYSKYFDEWSERDVRDFVHRDRNHPSVIMWSIGNEIPEQGSPQGGEMATRLTGFFHEEDPTRPTTSAFNSPEAAIRNHLGENVDLFGVNYRPWQYEQFMKEHPTWIVYGSETASCVSSRGVYHLPIEKYEKHPSLQLSGYDIIAPPWAYCPDVEFFYQDKLPNVLGEFVWTGFDYIGEPTPYFGAQFVFRLYRPGRLPQGSLLSLPEPVDEDSDGARAAALELGRAGRPGDSGDGLHERGGSRIIPERQIAGAQEALFRARGDSGRPQCQPGPEILQQVPAGMAGSLHARQPQSGRIFGREAGDRRPGEYGRSRRAHQPGAGSRDDSGRWRGSVIHHGARGR